LKTYFQMIAPLLMRIESPRREDLMRETMFMLGDAVAGGGAGNPLNARTALARGTGRIALASEVGGKLAEREVAEIAEFSKREQDSEEQRRGEVNRAADALGFD
ncbi:hypothetical protein ACFVUR_19200, partial [Stenotrophomonas bentonitica]